MRGLRPGETWPIRRGQQQRGNELLPWATFACLSAGTLLQGFSVSLDSWTRVELPNVLVSLSGRFLLAAAIGFVLSMWHRVRALGWGK